MFRFGPSEIGGGVSERDFSGMDITAVAWELATEEYGFQGNPRLADVAIPKRDMVVDGFQIFEGSILGVWWFSSVQKNGAFAPTISLLWPDLEREIWVHLDDPEYRDAFQFCKLVENW
jgi:hypothetical protein